MFSALGVGFADPIIAWRRIKRRHKRFRKREIAVGNGLRLNRRPLVRPLFTPEFDGLAKLPT
jgi:hypothetical protein